MLAIVEAYRAGLFRLKYAIPNLVSGTIVAVVALPLAMAFAIASGAKPEQGLYTAIIAAFLVGIFGGSRVQIAGPTGAFIVILANITAHYGFSGLQLASLMAGFILIFMGLIKLGSVIKFIPSPVIVGFTSGIGVIIFVGEWKDFLGLPVHLPLDAHFYQKIMLLFHALPQLSLATTGLALLSLLLVIGTPRFLKRIPGPLVALIVSTLLQAVFHFKGVSTIGSAFGGIPRQLPHWNPPVFTFEQCLDLVGSAFTIALLGAIESLLSATAADNMANTHHDSNQELIGQGIANIFSPLLGGFAATGAIARTATNIRNGGNSPLAAVTHSSVLVFVLVFLAPLASNIPLCTLAAILFVVAYNMSDLPHFFHIIKRAPSYDICVLWVTFLLTVFTNLVVAVNVGVILAMLFFVRRMSQSVNIEKQSLASLQEEFPYVEKWHSANHHMNVYMIQGPIFFGVAEKIAQALVEHHINSKMMVFRFKNVPFVDVTGLEAFKTLVQHLSRQGVRVFLTETNPKVAKKLSNSGILSFVEGHKIFDCFSDIVESAIEIF